MRQKTTLITGANRGLGFEAARLFLEHGYRVVFAGRSRGALEEARRRLDPVGTRTSTLKLNMASPGLLHRVPGQPEAAGIQLDVLGDNAGVFPRDGDPVDGLRHAVETNVTGAVALTLAGSSHWLNAPEPRVAMVSSGLGGLRPVRGRGRAAAGLEFPRLSDIQGRPGHRHSSCWIAGRHFHRRGWPAGLVAGFRGSWPAAMIVTPEHARFHELKRSARLRGRLRNFSSLLPVRSSSP
jgi:NAD(P)-dependent dehydrogenase (short-subunit alcohol dehydrogenase family)